MPRYKIFISYRRAGTADKAEHLFSLLEKSGYKGRVSFDRENFDGTFDLEILRRIDRCKDFILVVGESTFANISVDEAEAYKHYAKCSVEEFDVIQRKLLSEGRSIDFVRFEIARAIEKKKNIVPVVLAASDKFDFDRLQLPDDISQIKHFVGIILRESERMSNLVDDMLLLSRIEFTEKNVRENFSLFPVSAAISEAVSVHESELSAKNDNIQVDCPGALEMRGDFCLIQMAVSNLISNAVKYGGDSCSIRIAARRKFDDIEISVSDTGPGISAADLPRVFERFFRADKGRSRALGGTGLGLAIVKHIAILHGGGVAVSSTPGSGSIFTITFKA